MQLQVTKMHALGNNYIYVEEKEVEDIEHLLPQLAVDISDVRKGMGSDGLIVIGTSRVADVRMRIFNADGSEAENCGNGLRCVAKYAYEHGLVGHTAFTIETKGGVFSAQVLLADGRIHQVTINMGPVQLGANTIPFAGPDGSASATDVTVSTGAKGEFTGTLVSVGNPHFVTFVPSAIDTDVATVGPLIEHHPWFPERINVEFVTPQSRRELDFRVWERGSGITYACGTGACASVAAGVAKGLLDEAVRVHLLGGDLDIEIREGQIWMTGEAVHVFSGMYEWSVAE